MHPATEEARCLDLDRLRLVLDLDRRFLDLDRRDRRLLDRRLLDLDLGPATPWS